MYGCDIFVRRIKMDYKMNTNAQKILNLIKIINEERAAEQADLLQIDGMDTQTLITELNYLYQNQLITTLIPPRISKRPESYGQILSFGRIMAINPD